MVQVYLYFYNLSRKVKAIDKVDNVKIIQLINTAVFRNLIRCRCYSVHEYAKRYLSLLNLSGASLDEMRALFATDTFMHSFARSVHGFKYKCNKKLRIKFLQMFL